MCQVNRENEWYLKPLQIYFPAKYFIRIVFLGYILENFNPIDPSIKLWINVYLAHWLWLLTGLRPSWDRREELRLPELLGHHDQNFGSVDNGSRRQQGPGLATKSFKHPGNNMR